MNIRYALILAVSLTALTACNKKVATDDTASPAAASAAKFDTPEKKISYILGAQLGTQFKNSGITIEKDSFLNGLQDARDGKPPQMSDKEVKDTMAAFQAEMMKKQQAQQASQKATMEAAVKTNQVAADKFLAENGKRKEVTTTKSGLQYEVITAGKGAKPGTTDMVTVNYKGSLLSGEVFDSSTDGKAQFGVTQVIPGWTEALQLMSEGSKWKVYVPAKLAYGEAGAGGKIGPNEMLTFEVELLKVEKPKAN